MLIDEVEIKVKAGNGGPGSVSFKRNGQTARGGPDGGNGGNGGDIYFQGVDDITALRQFQFKKLITAEEGIPGKKNNLYGKNADEKTVKVPLGTIVLDLNSNQSFEITNVEDKVLVAKGGVGGRGNNEFKSATVQAPRYAEPGTPGEERSFKLSLAIIADSGLIGLPNAGKSSILTAITNATPRIGDYPFTTLEPNLGVMGNMVIADIPGLIEGASEGKGLGFRFLKHIQRTKFIVHCISLENDDLLKTYNIVNEELEKFDPNLPSKTRLILLTKKDLFTPEEIKNKAKSIEKLEIEFFPFSILDTNDIQYLIGKLKEIYSNESKHSSS
jgi:GTP-binding protein